MSAFEEWEKEGNLRVIHEILLDIPQGSQKAGDSETISNYNLIRHGINDINMLEYKVPIYATLSI